MSKTKLAILALIIANIIWGGAAPIFKWSMQDVHPFTLAFLRFFIPSLLIAIFAFKKLSIRPKDFMLFLFAGLFGISLNIGAFFLGILHTESINSPVISSAGPVFVIIGSILFLGEHPTRKMLVGNLLSLSGVMLIVLEPLFHTNTLSSIGGNMLLILATLGSIVGTLLVKKLSKRYNAITLTFWTFAVGTVTFLPFAFQEYQQYGLASQLQFPGLMGILYGAIFSSFIAYTLLYWALRYLMASQTTIFTYMDPVVAILIAAPLIHEYPSIFFILGSIFVFSGMWVAEGRLNYHPFHKLFSKR